MASEILDVVTRFTYDVQDDELIAAGNAVKANINNINVLTAALQKQQAAISQTSRLDLQKRKEQQAAINATKAAIDKETKALETNILANKDLQKVISAEIGLIGKLQSQMDVLRQKRDLATDPNKIRAFSHEINKIQSQVSGLTSGKGAGSGIGSGILQGLGLGGGFALANLAVQGIAQVKEFINESSRLAAETEGVQRAFNRLDSPGLLDNLRAATKGTVSDLELMKNAVQFSNFGLPVSKLATGLEFARIRAKETGQSVEYLVNSITTGIGRQSPLILDNLGINARRVREEFQKTGDFAEAAFKIIQEETQKAGADLETFTEKQSRLNATIENSQAKFGSFINQYKGFLLSIGEDLFNGLNDAETNLTGRYLQDVRDLKQNAADLQRIQANADALFLVDFKDFATQFKTANFQTRQEIKDNAKTAYDTLLKNNKEFYKNDQEAFNFYSQGLQAAYQRLLTTFKTTKVDLKTITPADIAGYSKDQLTDLQDNIDIARTSLRSSDTEQIERLNRLTKAVKDNLDIISGANIKSQEKDLDKWKKYLEDKKKALEEAVIIFRKLTLDTIREADTAGIVDSILGSPKNIANAQAQILKSVLPQLLKETQAELDKRNDSSLPKGITPEQRAAQIGIAIDLNETDRKTPSAFQNFVLGKEDAKNIEDPIKRQKEAVSELIDVYTQLGQSAQAAYNTIVAAQQAQLQAEINIRQSRIEQATALAERGNTEALRIEQQRLEEAYKMQEEAARRQAFINSLLATSYAIAAVAKAALEGGGFLSVATVAATVAALISGYATVRTLTADTGFAEGGYTGDGSKHEKAGTVHKGEFVFTKEKTAQHRDLFEAIHTGKINQRSMSNSYASTTDVKGLESRLDMLIDATEGSSTKVNARVDENGIAIITERYKKAQRRKWS